MKKQRFNRIIKLTLIVVSALFITTCKKTQQPPPMYTISALLDSPNGTISTPGDTVVPAGSDVTYTITPSPNYGILSLIVDDTHITSPTNTYTFKNVTANHIIQVAFAKFTKFKLQITNGTATYTPAQPVDGEPITITITPNPTFHTESLYEGTTLTKSLAGATNVIAFIYSSDETITVTCTRGDLAQAQLDSLANLLKANWTMISYQARFANNNLVSGFDWEAQSISGCSADSYDQFTNDGQYLRYFSNPDCVAIAGSEFAIRSPNHWTLKKDGTVIYMTDPPVDSLTNVTITKDSLIARFLGGFPNSPNGGKISYWYHYARKQ